MFFSITPSIAIGPKPNFQSMQAWIEMLKQNNITHVISLISLKEIIAYGIENEKEMLLEQNIDFIHFPIDDYDIPDEEEFIDIMKKLNSLQKQKQKFFIHCAGGVGRAGTLAACLLVAQGYDADAAVKLISEKRTRPSPETTAQIEFIRHYQQLCCNI